MQLYVILPGILLIHTTDLIEITRAPWAAKLVVR